MASRSRIVSVVRSRAPAGSVSVGGTIVPLRSPAGGGLSRHALSPSGYLERLPDALRPALRWLAQKDALSQDAMLLTSPAERARARFLALAYAELVNAELEYVAISSDTTEADLKQRRELLPGGNVNFSDSPPVRAALHGRVLLLDGLERAERNVLPTLNNLLENRELSLDDGRLLIAQRRFDAIEAAASPSDGPAVAKLAPVHSLFRVIALASPCPPFAGRALDPPLRSRFQALLVPPLGAEELAEAFCMLPSDLSRTLASAGETIAELERQATRHDPSGSFFSFSSTALREHCSSGSLPSAQAYDILKRVYPPLGLAGFDNAGVSAVRQSLAKLGIKPPSGSCGDTDFTGKMVSQHFQTPAIADTVAAILADLDAGRNVLLIGGRGSGKSALLRSMQDGSWRTFALHRDLTARDLLQRRVTNQESGASSWADQPCVAAVRAGGTAVLDGLHRLGKGACVAALSRLCTERELDLPDGVRLVEAERLEFAELSSRCAPFPSTFRLVALAEPGEWLTPEIAALFSTHVLPELTPLEMQHAARALVPTATPAICQAIADVAAAAIFTQSDNSFSANERSLLRLSPRVLLKLARRLSASDSDDEMLRRCLHDALMSKFLPARLQTAIDNWLRVAGIIKPKRRRPAAAAAPQPSPELTLRDDTIGIGRLSLQRRTPRRPELVPSPHHFFGSAAATRALVSILQCEYAGERSVLLLGNQGVGKNVAVDRVLEMLRAEREYVQLHRDTTVSSLTVLPVLEGGRLRFEDAPLVRAAVHGRICVLDEADKAPTEVVVILKALIEDGELVLGDGRRLLGGAALEAAKLAAGCTGFEELPSDIVPVHCDFRLWVLANRPGFPFHGNAFFRECGDVFVAIALDNPDVDSETALLEHVAPTYPERSSLRRLALAFAELRSLAEKGIIAYPYSMREAVAVGRHLEKFPGDSVAEALKNVFAFEAFDSPLRQQLAEVFEKHGFKGVAEGLDMAFGSVAGEIGSPRLPGSGSRIGIEYIPLNSEGGENTPRTGLEGPKHGEVDPTGAPHVGGNRWAGGSGGSDTAGLGGRGGPYRLSDGNPVYQVNEEAKRAVSQEAREKARALGQQAWRERLSEIEGMSESMWSMYNGVLGSVEPQISQLQAILRQAMDKKRERVWLRNRTDGELDDSRLVEGVAGDRAVFKRRGQAEAAQSSSAESDQRRKRRICFVMDCSGSMYRFNGLDGRLNRMLEVTCLILESMEGHLDRFEYSVLGHSGETAKVEFVEFGKPPANRGERLKILQKMLAHTQFCWPGDHTIEATSAAIDHVRAAMSRDMPGEDDEEDADGDSASDQARAFVVVLSDANFRRYQMDPLWWSEALMRDKAVQCHAVMIGSLGEEAKSIQVSLPPGRGHIVLDTALLPSTFRSIFEQAGLFGDEF